MRKLIKRKHLKELLGGVSDSTIDRWEHRGLLPQRIVIVISPNGRPLTVMWDYEEVLKALARLPCITPSWVERETEPAE